MCVVVCVFANEHEFISFHKGMKNLYATDPAADTSAMEVRLGVLVRGLFTKQDRQDERSSQCKKEKGCKLRFCVCVYIEVKLPNKRIPCVCVCVFFI